eukprot:TRINITY_DN2005_c0_g1_i1.p1 TRINITY_DN2005_c0_g1~~TRINITY_DN2005_c0_g1_i1.p1  ORF type:complete len:1015 (+),score=98.25 TRINITY_DN2005_c0_g1_i1:170-3214(+)
MAVNHITKSAKFQKSYFDVVGLCCSSEVPLIEKILKPLDGIEKVSVIVPSRTVIVVHDALLISQIQIVKALNQARLDANVRVFGEAKNGKKWPSPYSVASGILLLLSFFKYLYHPMQWLALGAVAVGLPPIVLRSVAAIRSLTLDINILALIAVGGTIALKDYWEAGSIVFLFTIAEWLESRASHKATAVMSSLMCMAPQKAILAETGLVVDVKDVMEGTILAVKAGEVIPIDGIVVEGKSEVDERSLTGESVPVAKQVHSTVWAGTMNLNGYISIKTNALAEDSAVARMAKLVEEAQNNKSKTQRYIDKCATYYTPAVVLVSVGFVVIPTALKVNDLKHWFRLALVVLVSACPCALVLSTPVATFCALTKAATTGILIKGGNYLEDLAKIKNVAFDKTGTITKGEFSVVEFKPLSEGVSLNTLLYWVSSIEGKSSHPMADALVEYSKLNCVEPKPENVKEFQIFPGEGIFGEIDGKNIYVGNKRIAARAIGSETVPDLEGMKEGETVGYIFSGTTLSGIFSLSDTCRPRVAEAIAELKSFGIKTLMLTGDSHAAAMHVQNQLGHAIETVHAELLPQDKVGIIKEFKTKEGSTAMIGDGMNDAPALAMADIGISMGISGSAVATETGHVTLMSNDITKIPQAIRLARKTRRKIFENIGASIVTKSAILALAFAGHPIIWAAVVADVGTCLLVILNSMLLLQGSTTSTPHRKKCCSSSHAPHRKKHGLHGSGGHCSGGEHAKVSSGSDGPCCQPIPDHQHCHSHGDGPQACDNESSHASHVQRHGSQGSGGQCSGGDHTKAGCGSDGRDHHHWHSHGGEQQGCENESSHPLHVQRHGSQGIGEQCSGGDHAKAACGSDGHDHHHGHSDGGEQQGCENESSHASHVQRQGSHGSVGHCSGGDYAKKACGSDGLHCHPTHDHKQSHACGGVKWAPTEHRENDTCDTTRHTTCVDEGADGVQACADRSSVSRCGIHAKHEKISSPEHTISVSCTRNHCKRGCYENTMRECEEIEIVTG